MKPIIQFCIVAVFIVFGCGKSETVPDAKNGPSDQQMFFEQLSDLCGQEFDGKTVFPNDPRHELHEANLKMHIKKCEEDEIQIPFYVDGDSSRTWVLRKTERGLQLKHDHRNPDGTASEQTNYGGYANRDGDRNRQFFEADSLTADLIPEASTNVWMMEVDFENKRFVYFLQRNDSPRFRAEFPID